MAKYAAAGVGIEGIVAKGLDQRYRGGSRDWLKYRHRDSVDVIVGAVTGSADRPERLVLGLFHDDELHIVGGTSAFRRRNSGRWPRCFAAGGEHPWPTTIGGGHVGYWGGKDIDIVRVEPRARRRGRRRHRVRARPLAPPHDVSAATSRPAPE